MRPLSITIDPGDASGTPAAPTSEQLAHLAAKWFNDLQEFRAWEDARMFGEQPLVPLDSRLHRYQLSALMTDGETILLGMALNSDAQSLSSGVTRETIEANQRCLQLTFVDWHGDMSKQRRQELFEQVFHDPQSAS
jgi:hypothetical protein